MGALFRANQLTSVAWSFVRMSSNHWLWIARKPTYCSYGRRSWRLLAPKRRNVSACCRPWHRSCSLCWDYWRIQSWQGQPAHSASHYAPSGTALSEGLGSWRSRHPSPESEPNIRRPGPTKHSSLNWLLRGSAKRGQGFSASPFGRPGSLTSCLLQSHDCWWSYLRSNAEDSLGLIAWIAWIAYQASVSLTYWYLFGLLFCQ